MNEIKQLVVNELELAKIVQLYNKVWNQRDQDRYVSSKGISSLLMKAI
ncbi:hypothetical protein ACFSTA_01390 [Ornithinibacillus salinisoli]|uniref:Uncharacterized protein n=1 Tax=Ornithinibacillus salinisoli TaxID=1848459 RepID=A0ABW4VW88_9BACI